MESTHTSGTGWSRAWCCQFHRWHQKSFSWSSSVSLWVAPVGDRFVGSPSFPAPENKASQGTTGRYYALKIKHHNVEANTKLTLRRIPELAFASLSCTLQWLNNSCSSRFSSMLERSSWSDILWGDWWCWWWSVIRNTLRWLMLLMMAYHQMKLVKSFIICRFD